MKWFQPNSFGEVCFLEERYENMQTIQIAGGAGKARFNVATPTYATVTCTAYVLPYNFQTKSIYHYFKKGCKVAPRRIFG